MKTRIVYLDHAATTPLDPGVLEVMLPFMKERYGNPSSLHTLGLEAHRALEAARERCAALLETKARAIVFTASGTEANNLIVKGFLPALEGRCLVLTGLEHASVAEPAGAMARRGVKVRTVKNDDKGRVDRNHLEALLGEEDCGLLCVIHGSNEVATLQDVAAMSRIVQSVSPKTWFHLDAVQSLGHVPFSPSGLGIRSMTCSSHKIHGPRGSGILALYHQADLEPLVAGGGQEGGRRSGTENLPAIVGAAEALDRCLTGLADTSNRIRGLRDRLARGIEESIPDILINGDPEGGLPHVLSVSFNGIVGEVLLHHLEEQGIMVSTGSACHARWKEVSDTLKALRIPKAYARGTIRFSLSRYNTEEEIDYTLEVLPERVAWLREVGIA